MPTDSFTLNAKVGGSQLNLTANVAGGANGTWQPTLPLAAQATGWTNGSNSTGTAAFASGTTITTGMTIDLYWSGGYRYGMAATVAGNNVSLSGGVGNNCPASGVTVTLAQQFPMTLALSGNAIKGIMGTATSPSLFVFYDSLANAYPYYLDPGTVSGNPAGLFYSSLTAGLNPWANKLITSATVSSSNIIAPTSPAVNQPVTVLLVYDNTTGSGS